MFRLISLLAMSAGCLITTGCMSPYSQPGYGYGYGAPGYMSPGYMAPGQAAPMQYPQGQMQYPGTFSTVPGSVSPQPMMTPGTEINVSPGGSTYDPEDTLGSESDEGDFFGSGSSNNRVPRPRDIGADFDSEDLRDPDGFGRLDTDAPAFTEQFREPVPINTAVSKPRAQPVNNTTPFNVDVYDHDDQYRWLQGVLKRDRTQGGWYVVYDFKQSDEFGGDLTLLDHRLLEKMHDGEIVLIHGELIRNRTDQNGKPMYQVERIRVIDPDQVSG